MHPMRHTNHNICPWNSFLRSFHSIKKWRNSSRFSIFYPQWQRVGCAPWLSISNCRTHARRERGGGQMSVDVTEPTDFDVWEPAVEAAVFNGLFYFLLSRWSASAQISHLHLWRQPANTSLNESRRRPDEGRSSGKLTDRSLSELWPPMSVMTRGDIDCPDVRAGTVSLRRFVRGHT